VCTPDPGPRKEQKGLGSIRRLTLAATCSAKLTRFAASHFATVAEVMNAVPVMTAPVALLSLSKPSLSNSSLSVFFFFWKEKIRSKKVTSLFILVFASSIHNKQTISLRDVSLTGLN